MRNFKNRFLVNLLYFFSWVGYFFIARFLFLLFYYEKTSELHFTSILKTFFYGIRLDMSFASYLSLFPFLVVIFSLWIPRKHIANILKVYTFPIVFTTTLLMLVDIGLYASWGVRIDATLLNYINTPKIMLASVSTLELISSLFAWIFLSLLFVFIFNNIINSITINLSKGHFLQAPIFLLFFGSLIIPLRGGLQLIPVNQSNVYFSNNMFANHAAVNYAWNFGNTLTHKVDDVNPYKKINSETAKSIIKKQNEVLRSFSTDSILKTDKPNVILIVWESLSAKVVGAVGGEPNVTENLNKLSEEGILFTNFYGNGDRTDKGLVAILSGYYPQATSSIIKMPHKTRNLPILQSEMKKIGYNTSFYYGGDINFGNINTYIRNGNIDKVVDGSEFDKENWNSKWGAHDHIFLERLAKDLSQPQQEPFFVTALTLTSHEPFEFPDTYKFGKNSEDNLYRSSQAYTDKAIGNFIKSAKKQPWWNNTLVVIMSDHGHPLPKHKGYFNSPIRFQIPMLWLGGALNKTGIKVNTVAAQTDFSYTLLKLLNGNTSEFIWGKNVFNTNDNQYAHYIFNKGFGTVTKQGSFVYDYVSNKPVIENGNTKKIDSLGFSITQEAYQDFMNR